MGDLFEFYQQREQAASYSLRLFLLSQFLITLLVTCQGPRNPTFSVAKSPSLGSKNCEAKILECKSPKECWYYLINLSYFIHENTEL